MYVHTVTGCPELSNPNGSFNYTDSQFVGSLATLTCDANYEVTGPNPVTCQANGEWTGTPTCEGKTIRHTIVSNFLSSPLILKAEAFSSFNIETA